MKGELVELKTLQVHNKTQDIVVKRFLILPKQASTCHLVKQELLTDLVLCVIFQQCNSLPSCCTSTPLVLQEPSFASRR